MARGSSPEGCSPPGRAKNPLHDSVGSLIPRGSIGSLSVRMHRRCFSQHEMDIPAGGSGGGSGGPAGTTPLFDLDASLWAGGVEHEACMHWRCFSQHAMDIPAGGSGGGSGGPAGSSRRAQVDAIVGAAEWAGSSQERFIRFFLQGTFFAARSMTRGVGRRKVPLCTLFAARPDGCTGRHAGVTVARAAVGAPALSALLACPAQSRSCSLVSTASNGTRRRDLLGRTVQSFWYPVYSKDYSEWGSKWSEVT